MMAKIPALLLVLLAGAVIVTGCTSAAPAAKTPQSTVPAITTAAPAQSPDRVACTNVTDCVPAQCCHAAGCTVKALAPDCSGTSCTARCEGPLDCGAGTCGCVNGTCAVIPAASGLVPAAQKVSVKLEAAPQRYSPIMSSTPGVRLTPNITGFVPAASEAAGNATDFAWSPVTCEWNATFGTFLTWEAPDYTVRQIGNPVANGCGTVYWTFIDTPVSVNEPVTVTVTARDATRQGAVPGRSTVTLNWDGNTAVYVGKIT